MVSLLIRWFVNATGLWVVWQLMSPHIRFEGIASLLIAAVALGLLNAVIRPILVFLTFPATIVTLGLFILVVNGVVFWMLDLLPGVKVDGIVAAIVASIIYSIFSYLTSWIGKKDKKKDD